MQHHIIILIFTVYAAFIGTAMHLLLFNNEELLKELVQKNHSN